eukprot:895369-Pyramimonas_sp.AAC.2
MKMSRALFFSTGLKNDAKGMQLTNLHDALLSVTSSPLSSRQSALPVQSTSQLSVQPFGCENKIVRFKGSSSATKSYMFTGKSQAHINRK